jgi:murein DD-endopeptidase MepM/ murein hydrolase activator NlpD
MTMKRAFLVSITVALAAYALMPMPGQSASSGLQNRIDEVRGKIKQKRQKEAVLTRTITRFNNRIASLQGEIRGLQDRQNRIETTLDQKRADLITTQNRLEKARDRLAQLKVYLAKAEKMLSDRLVQMYKEGDPDALTVILESNGFAELLESTEFLGRITDQDNKIIARVRDLKSATTKQAKQLGALQKHQAATVQAIQARRNEVAAVKGRLVNSRGELQSVRDGRRAVLTRVQESRHVLEGDLSKMQAQVSAQLRSAQGAPSAGPVRHGSGALIWPVNGPVSSGFGMRWGRLHAGIDIPAPTGTPIRAADSGQVAIAGWMGGYGNYTCIQHTGSLSTCYGHQSAIGVSVGQGVSQGQVIGAVGNTGHSFGSHLHFETRINGSPVDPMGYL